MSEVHEDEECVGLFGPCHSPVTHHLEDPDGRLAPVPLCKEHWDWTMDLEEKLRADPEFKARFAQAVEEAASGGKQ